MRESAVRSAARANASCSQVELQNPTHLTTQRHVGQPTLRVLLVIEHGDAQRAIVRSLSKRSGTPELLRSMAELKVRLSRDDLAAPEVVFLDLDLPDAEGEEWVYLVRQSFVHAAVVAFGKKLNAARAARLLGFGVPSLRKPVAAGAFADLALELNASLGREPHELGGVADVNDDARRFGGLHLALDSYASVRALSKQQRLILGFYLSGENDKEIAHTLVCSAATVYEHWRRMGKKAGGCAKASVISDFHRFLVRN